MELNRYPKIETPSYNNLDKINERDLTDRVDKVKNDNQRNKEKYAEQLKTRRTEVVNEYLLICNKEYIEDRITRGIASDCHKIVIKFEAINYHQWPEKSDNFRHAPIIDRYDICHNKLKDLDIFHEQLTVDLDKSIVDLIRDVVPDDYRVYALYGLTLEHSLDRRFEVSLRRGSICCNDPCCYLLCCKNMFLLNSFCCLGDDEPDCCHCPCWCGP